MILHSSVEDPLPVAAPEVTREGWRLREEARLIRRQFQETLLRLQQQREAVARLMATMRKERGVR